MYSITTIQPEDADFVNNAPEIELTLKQIQVDYNILPRESIDKEFVQILLDELELKDRRNELPILDPIHVFEIDGEFILARGLYRYHAYKEFKEKNPDTEIQIPAIAFTGTREVLICHICTSASGEKPIKGYSRKEKRTIVENYLQIPSNRPPSKNFSQLEGELAIASDKTIKAIWESATEQSDGTLKFERKSNVLEFPKKKQPEPKGFAPETEEEGDRLSSEFRNQDYYEEDHGSDQPERSPNLPNTPKQVNDVRSEKERLQQQIEQLEQVIAQQNKELGLLTVVTQERDEYQASIERMQSASSELLQQNADLSTQISEMSQEILKLNARIDELNSDLSTDLPTESMENISRIEDLENQLRQFKNEKEREIAKGSGWAKRCAVNAVHGLTHSEVLSDFNKLQSDDARAAFARTWLAKSAEALKETWGAFYSLFSMVKEGELYKKSGSLSGSTVFNSIQEYFDSTLKPSFDILTQIESETSLISSFYPGFINNTSQKENNPHSNSNEIILKGIIDLAKNLVLIAKRNGSTSTATSLEVILEENISSVEKLQETLSEIQSVSETEKIKELEETIIRLQTSPQSTISEDEYNSILEKHEEKIQALKECLKESEEKRLQEKASILKLQEGKQDAAKVYLEIEELGGLESVKKTITEVASLKVKIEKFNWIQSSMKAIAEAVSWTKEEKEGLIAGDSTNAMEKLKEALTQPAELPRDPNKQIDIILETSGFARMMEKIFSGMDFLNSLLVNVPGDRVVPITGLTTLGLTAEGNIPISWKGLFRGAYKLSYQQF